MDDMAIQVPEMVTVADIQFKTGGKNYSFDPGKLTLEPGQEVIIDTQRGLEFGICKRGNHGVLASQVVQPLRPVVRLATDEDRRRLKDNEEKETQAFDTCQRCIERLRLDMKLVRVEYAFDGSKLLFFFTSDGRVDFRELVKELAAIYRTRIEMRQIGVRDEAKLLGGLGICGRLFCCNQFLDDFQPVSIKMAKTQSLSLNPTKNSGTCGRLMCCLKYEQEAYEDLVKHAPKQESFVETPDGAGTVSSVNLLRQTVQVRLESAPETPKIYHNCELCVIRNGKGKRPEGYVEPPLSELAKLRKQEEPAALTPEDSLAAALAALEGNNYARKTEPAPANEQSEGSRSSHRRRRGGRAQNEGGPNGGERSQEERSAENRPPRSARTVRPAQEEERAPRPEGDGERRPPRRRRRRPGGSGRRPEENGGQE